MLFFIVVIVLAGLFSIMLQKNNFSKIVVEYNEMNAIHDLNYSLNKLVNSFDDMLILKTDSSKRIFQSNIIAVNNDYLNCFSIITERHSSTLLFTMKKVILRFNDFNEIIKQQKNGESLSDLQFDSLVLGLKKSFNAIDAEIIQFQKETRDEIDQYILIDRNITKYSIYTLIVIGSLIIIGSVLWGISFVRKRTGPIYKLIDFTEKISEGNLSLKTDLRFGNELDFLAGSFNKMVERLNNTTISRNYFDNIIGSMQDLIIVTNNVGEIQLVNKSVLHILGYTEEELIGHKINIIFAVKEVLNENILKKHESDSIHNRSREINLCKKSGEEIPVYLSVSKMVNESQKDSFMIFVAHDISEKNKITNQLEKERKERVVAIIEAQEEERLRIATDLHDGLGQMLTGLLYYVENNLNEKYDSDKVLVNHFSEISSQLTSAIRESKNIAHNIIPMLLNDFGLVVAVRKLVTQLNNKNEYNVTVDEFNFESRVDPRIEKILYRICQEAMNNIIKHSQAKNVSIQFIKHEHSVVLLIDDDGVGFDVKEVNLDNNFSGIGLISMKERVAAFNGTLSISSEKGKGTEILIELPC